MFDIMDLGNSDSVTTNTFDWTGGSMQPKRIIGNLSNGGGDLVIKDDTVSISGNYTQAATGKIKFVLQSQNTAPALGTKQALSSTGLLNIEGDLSLSGQVQVTLDGYRPRPGDTIRFIKRSATSASLSSQSGALLSSDDIDFDLEELDNGMSWDTSSFASEGTLTILSSTSKTIQSRPLNYPNPFTPSQGTEIVYFLNESSTLDLRVYTAWGQEVYRTTVIQQAGQNTIPINSAITGGYWPSGVYPYLIMKNGKVVAKGKLAVMPE